MRLVHPFLQHRYESRSNENHFRRLSAVAEDQMQKIQVFQEPTTTLKRERDAKFMHNNSSEVDSVKEEKK